MKYLAVLLLCLVASAAAKVYFQEEFGSGWENRWVLSKHKGAEAGKFDVSAGKYYGDANNKGLRTTQDAKFYQIAAKFPKFSNKDKTLVVQYSVKHEQNIDCGGGYLKLMPSSVDLEDFNGDSKYNIMFGPDICGYSNKKVHVIFNYKGQNHLLNKEIKCKDDELTHLYTLIVRPDNTYEVLIDGESAQKGTITEDWSVLLPKEIKDPKSKKPADWVDEAEIADPEDKKPEGWENIPQYIPDPEAKKPEDWDEEADGAWEAPTIENPEYKGEWKPRMIKNPDYKGPWIHPMVPNPDYKDDTTIYSYEDFGAVGIEVWQVKSGTIFDHFLITDSEEEAKTAANQVLDLIKTEKAAKEKADEEAKKAREAEAAKKDTEEEDQADEEEDDDEKEVKSDKHAKDEL